MRNFEKFRNAYSLIIVTIASILTAFTLNYLQSKIQKDSSLSFIITIGLVSVIIILVNLSVEKLIDNKKWFRKLIDPSNFIEGYWYDKSFDNGVLKHVVILNICYENGNYVIHAETFDKLKNHIANFTTTQSAFSNKQLFAFVNVNYIGKGNDQGIDHFIFGSPATSYTCSYIDFHGSGGLKRVDVSGERIDDTKIKIHGGLKTLDNKKKFLDTIL